MREMEKTELMNLCMIYDGDGNVLLQNRRKRFGQALPFREDMWKRESPWCFRLSGR